MADEGISSSPPTRPGDQLLPSAAAGSTPFAKTPSGGGSSNAKNVNDRMLPHSDDDGVTSRENDGSGRGGGEGCCGARRDCGCCGGLSNSLDCYWPRRYTIVILLCIGMLLVNAQRVNIGVATVSILDPQQSGGETPAAEAANREVPFSTCMYISSNSKSVQHHTYVSKYPK